jgi:Ca2+-binding EF-hand superfamily protein
VSRIDGAASPTPVVAQSPPAWKLGNTGSTDAASSMSKLSRAQVRELRDVFQVLDRDSDGLVKRDDVADMLSSLGKFKLCVQTDDTGQNSSSSAVDAFFPPNGQQSLSLPQFLTTLSNLLSPLSPPQELTAAFAAFDEDDSGQINAAELRDAVLNTAPEGDGRSLSEHEVDKIMSGFLGRRTFGNKKMGRDETFRYQEFVSAVSGASTKEAEKAE